MSTISERNPVPNVLLVEDNRGDATLMKLAFRRADIPSNVTVAVSAEIALNMLEQTGEYADFPTPDLILMDLNLPKIHGRELLARLKSNEALRIIPVVVLSSSSAVSDLTACYQDFANGFVVKPISLDDYDNLIKVIEDYWFGLMQTLPSATNTQISQNAVKTYTSRAIGCG